MTIAAGELIFIDTNVLLSATDTSRESHNAANTIFSNIIISGYNPVACGQVMQFIISKSFRRNL